MLKKKSKEENALNAKNEYLDTKVHSKNSDSKNFEEFLKRFLERLGFDLLNHSVVSDFLSSYVINLESGIKKAESYSLLPDRTKSLSDVVIVSAHNAWNSNFDGAFMSNQRLSLTQ